MSFKASSLSELTVTGSLRFYLQLNYIGIGILYLLNGIEAFVDRHLQEFDISKDLSFKYQLDPIRGQAQLGIYWHFGKNFTSNLAI